MLVLARENHMLDLAREVARRSGPFSSISLDVTRESAEAPDEIGARLKRACRRLARLGAPRADIDVLGGLMASRPGRGGPSTRVAVAQNGRVQLDVVLPGRPPRDEATFGPAPHLLPIVRQARWPAPYVVADVDRAGADIEIVADHGQVVAAEEVVGTHDVLHKVPAGGWSHRRIQARAQDSWDRNAAEVANEINRIVADLGPAMLLVDGDPDAVSAMVGSLGGAAAALVTRLESGGRADGINEAAHRKAIDYALATRARADVASVIDQFAAAESKQLEAAQGFSDVISALRRGQVERILLHDDPSSTLTVWSGLEPLPIGTDRQELVDLGVPAPTSMRADAVLVRAALASGADIVILDEADLTLVDGIAALLRWSDRSTPHDAAPAMPGHGDAPGAGRAD